jgi:hypothetical protein
VDVATRLRLALKDWPQLRIQETGAELQTIGEQMFLVCTVTVWRDERDAVPVIASAAEVVPGRTPYTRNAERMVGFTSALGRALGYMGYGIEKSIASQDEVAHRQDAPEDPWPLTEQQEQKRAISQIVEKESNKRKMENGNAPATPPQMKMLKIQAKKAGMADDEALRAFCAETLNTELANVSSLTKYQASKCIEAILKEVAEKQMDREEPF